jgi:hypothetical protein
MAREMWRHPDFATPLIADGGVELSQKEVRRLNGLENVLGLLRKQLQVSYQ